MDVVEFIKSFPLKTFSKGEVLYSADDRADSVLVLRDGIVKACSTDSDGNERLLWIAGRYDIVPTEGVLKTSVTTRYAYIAFSDGSAYVVPKKELVRVAREETAIMSQIALGMTEHHDDLLSRLNSLEQPTLRAKIISMLLTVCEKFSPADSVPLHEVGLNLTHQDIADMVRASRESVSLELKHLQDEGLVEYSRATFTVHVTKMQQENEAPR